MKVNEPSDLKQDCIGRHLTDRFDEIPICKHMCRCQRYLDLT